MATPKVLIAVYTCEKYVDTRLQALRSTWLHRTIRSDITVRCFLAADGNGVREEGDVVYLDCPDGYQFLTVKTFALLKYALENYQFDFIVKVDDDVLVSDLPALIEALTTHDYSGCQIAARNQTWFFQNVPEAYRSPVPLDDFPASYMMGAIYALSRKAVRQIVATPEHLIPHLKRRNGLEDVMIGWIFEKLSAEDRSLTKKTVPALVGEPKSFLYLLSRLSESLAVMHLQPARMRLCDFLLRNFRPLLKLISIVRSVKLALIAQLNQSPRRGN